MKSCRTYLLGIWFSIFLASMGTALAQPAVNLGPDLLSCEPLLLDAGNAGATFLWSTGEVSQSITVDTTGIYWVEVTDMSGSSRDSILVEFQNAPTTLAFPPQDLCGVQDIFLNPNQQGEYVVWYSDSMGNEVIDVENPQVSVLSDTSFFGKNYLTQPGGNVGIDDNNIYPAGGFTSIQTGYAFDALQDLVIDSVAVYVNVNADLQIQLWDDQNNVLTERNVQAQAPDKYFVDLNIFVPAGSDYKLMLKSINGGVIGRNGNAAYPYPFEIPGSISITRHTTNGNNTIGTFSSVFYDWHISTLACESGWFAREFSIVDVPELSLAADTFACGLDSVMLTAGNNPGASYLWSTGDSTESIFVDQDGNYKVTAFLSPSCPLEDSIEVRLLDDVDLAFPRIGICGPQQLEINADTLNNLVLWYADSQATQFLDTRRINADILGDTVFYAKGFTTIQAGRAGIENDSLFVTGGFTSIQTGYAFDAHADMVLDSVAVYLNSPAELTIQLWDSNNVVLSERILSAGDNGKEFVDLTFFIEKGNDYKLMLTAIGPGRIFRNGNTPYPYPFELPGVLSITRHTTNGNNSVSSFSSVFYDWHVSLPYCESDIARLEVGVEPVPVINLPPDTLVCGFDSIQLIPGINPGATYQWSNGDSTEGTFVDTTGKYFVQAFIVAQCPVEDSIEAFLLEEVLPLSDTLQEVCTPQRVSLTPLTNSDVILWYEDSMSTTPFATQDIEVDVSLSKSFVTRTLNAAFLGTVGITNTDVYPSRGFTSLVSGNAFDALEDLVIDSILLYVNNPTDVTMQLWDANNVPILERVVSAPRIGNNYLPLSFYVPAGQDYKLMMVNLESPGLAFRNGNENYPYPFEIKDLIAIKRHTTDGVNNVTSFSSPLYNWHISKVACLSEPTPYTVSVKIPLDIELDQYACESFSFGTGLDNLAHEWALIQGPGQDSVVSSADTLFIPETGDYLLTITADPGCVFEDTLRVEIPRTAGLPDDGILCGNVLTTNYGEEAGYLWSTGDTTATLTLTNPDTISVTVFEPRGCILTDTIFVTGFDSFPDINLGDDFAACVSAVLDADYPNAFYNWSNGDSTEQIEVFSSGVYAVEVVNPNGCSGSDTIGVLINPAPVAMFSPSIGADGFSVTFINQSTFGTYLWDFGDGATSNSVLPFHVYQDTGVFVVTLITTNECGSDTMEQEIRIVDPSVSIEENLPEGILLYPNPGSGMVNLEWKGSSAALELEIYNSNGQQVMEKSLKFAGGTAVVLDLRHFPKGVYLLKIKENKEARSFFKRLVITK